MPRKAVTTDPVTAAQFGQRALEIVPLQHPQRGEIVATTAIALHIAGDSEQAIAFADRALRETLPTLQRQRSVSASPRCSRSRRKSGSALGRLALEPVTFRRPCAPATSACLLHNLVTAGRIDEARAFLEETRAMVESADDARASFTLRVAENSLEYIDDRFGRALELITSAFRDGILAGDALSASD